MPTEPLAPIRKLLQKQLDKINAGREEELVGTLLHVLLSGAKWVRVPRTPSSILIRKEGPHLRFTPETEGYEDAMDRFFALAHLVSAVGADRVRQCHLEGCSHWFIARKAQQYCSYEHAQRDRDRRKQEAMKS